MTRVIPSPIELQPRDVAFLKGLFESRIMTAGHAAALYFDGKSEAAKKRIQKLKSAGLINERPRRVYQPAIFFLTTVAFRLLSKEGHLAAPTPQLRQKARANKNCGLRHDGD